MISCTTAPHRIYGGHQEGVALVLVLAMLVLVTGLVLAFLQAVRTDLQSSATYEKSTSARLLAETALNVVIGQIQEATQRDGEAWVSQPGMIRTYGTNGDGVMGYKLYSDDSMRVSASDPSFDPNNGTDLPDPAAWRNRPNEYVDLNEPVTTAYIAAGGSPAEHRLFPIIDPRAADIVDGKPLVEGFSFDPQWKSDATSEPSLAMPVKWLYLLEDGSLAPGTGGAAETVSIDGSSATNRPVARIAFWTDDETSKVNINTASEGTLWDTPVANTFPDGFDNSILSIATRPTDWPDETFETDLAHFQPARNEFQRYPGHPATTALGPIFYRSIERALGTPTRSEVLEEIYRISPRYSGGADSSGAGTRRGSEALAPGGDRLYASLDELLYAPLLTGGSRNENALDATETERRALLERVKFFATANSKAPEVNLFNKPRVAIWPVHTVDDALHRTAFDSLIAFCGTVGESRQPYYFTRTNPLSATEDWNARNQEVYSYLQSLTTRPIPGFAGPSFASKLGADRDQVFTEIFDYIRCLNLQDSTVAQPYTDEGDDTLRGMVVPIIPPSGDPGAGTKGFGRIPSVSEVVINFIRKNPNNAGVAELQAGIIVELFCPMAGYSAMATNLEINFTDIDLRIGAGGASSVPAPFPLPRMLYAAHVPRSPIAPRGATSDKSHAQGGHSRLGGSMSPGILFYQQIMNDPGNPLPISDAFSVPGIVVPNDPLVIQAGSRIAFTVDTPHSGGPKQTVQRFDYEFTTDVTLKSPSYSARTMEERFANLISGSPNSLFEGRFNTSEVDTIVSIVPSGTDAGGGGTSDIQGDYRLPAAMHPDTNAADLFSIHEKSRVTTSRGGHSITSQGGRNPSRRSYGNLVTGKIGYNTAAEINDKNTINMAYPDVPAGINGVTNLAGAPGDWDNGVGLMVDGAYVNKADEGSTGAGGNNVPYIGGSDTFEQGRTIEPTLFSPNRQMPSAVMFGSLPTGVKRDQRWQTLLFRPDESYLNLPGGGAHAGSASPPDHLLLDLFWMPVVEPYAISEPFSTAGKVNLNYQIAPFSYIRRDTAIRAVLEGTEITALDADVVPSNGDSLIYRYKQAGAEGVEGAAIRFPIDQDATLEFFEERFATGRPFISASEICDVPLVPAGTVTDGAAISDIKTALGTFWADHELTGDNSLERPYAHIYPRLTTKSNTYTVHVRVQQLDVSPASASAGQFDSDRDRAAGEFRGSFVIERYLDPNSDSLVTKDSATGTLQPTTDENDPDAFLGPYKFRVVSSKQLAQ